MNTRSVILAAGALLLLGVAKASNDEGGDKVGEDGGESSGGIMDLIASMGLLDWIIVVLAIYATYAWFIRDWLTPDTSASDAASNYVIQTTAPPVAASGGPDNKGKRVLRG